MQDISRNIKLKINNFIGVFIFVNGEIEVSALMDAGTFVIHDSIVEEIIGLNAVSMSVDAELQTGELLKIVMENICHIVVEPCPDSAPFRYPGIPA